MDKLIGLYVALRDRKKEIQDRHKVELEPIEAGLMTLEAKLTAALDAAGVQKASGEHGTVFFSVTQKVAPEDWGTIMDYVVANKAYDVFERRLAKSAVLERGDVPGVHVTQYRNLNVRRK